MAATHGRHGAATATCNVCIVSVWQTSGHYHGNSAAWCSKRALPRLEIALGKAHIERNVLHLSTHVLCNNGTTRRIPKHRRDLLRNIACSKGLCERSDQKGCAEEDAELTRGNDEMTLVAAHGDLVRFLITRGGRLRDNHFYKPPILRNVRSMDGDVYGVPLEGGTFVHKRPVNNGNSCAIASMRKYSKHRACSSRSVACAEEALLARKKHCLRGRSIASP